jgi:hypothetical protein
VGAPETKIRSAFVTRLLTFPALPSVAWENVSFTPTTGTTYLRPFLLPGEPVQAELGTAGQNRHSGIYQISIYAPAGVGTSAAGTLRDNLIDFFKRGTTMTYSDITVQIQKAFPGPMLQETDWIHIPITIRYRLLAAN